MYLEKIEIKNYKNYVTENINFSKKINYITGKNGTGKTNLLDAIYYLSFTKSAFNKIEDENIKYNQNFFLNWFFYWLIWGNFRCFNRHNFHKKFRYGILIDIRFI